MQSSIQHSRSHLPRIAAPTDDSIGTETTLIADAVHSATRMMRADLACEEGIAGLARATFYSKFHFARAFRDATGTTPRRFLSALRMQRAKELLLETDLDVLDVSTTVGYSSVGTFSSRFSALVGASPRAWRQRGGELYHCPAFAGGTAGSSLRVKVDLADLHLQSSPEILVAAYEDPIVQGPPAACARGVSGGLYELQCLPPGTWHVVVTVWARDLTPQGGATVTEFRSWRQMRAFSDSTTEFVPAVVRPHALTDIDPPIVYGRAMPLLPPLPLRLVSDSGHAPVPGSGTIGHTSASTRRHSSRTVAPGLTL